MKIILLGGWGTLGKELQKIDKNLICPTKDEVNIKDKHSIWTFIKTQCPDVVINAAAVIDNRVLEKEPQEAISTNIIGAANVANVCIEDNIRYVYISTDYVYKGDRGNYTEDDELLPFNFYAWTKLGGEASANGVKNHLIIRTSFGKSTFSYSQAFVDKWSSKDYVDAIAPLIYEASISPITGVLNLGTDRKTLFLHAKERNPSVKPVKLSETSFFTPYDTSLNLQKWINYKSEKSICKAHTYCRACASDKMVKYLDLGLMPLPNNLENTSLSAKGVERYPLQVLFCEDCGLSQLSVVVDPEKMFSYYTYRSGVNGGYIKHCRQMAKDLKEKYSLSKDSFHIDIAGNDGTLLKEFKEEIGLRVLNVDPASNLAAVAESQGIPTVADFWSFDLSGKIVEKYGKADLITATNVFAHVDKIREFLHATQRVIKNTGVVVIECPYLIDFIENVEFDTIYHEHLSYISISPVEKLCKELNMKVIEVEKQNIHGGTVRIHITNKMNIALNENKSVNEYLNRERDNEYLTPHIYYKWNREVKHTIDLFANNLLELKKKGNKICAFACSAKGNTLLNSASINTDIIDCIYDQTPEKIGKFSPGTGIPVLHMQRMLKDAPDYLVILSWNFSTEIMKKCRDLGYKGKFIIPIPAFTIIE